jgi:hypothetical protein
VCAMHHVQVFTSIGTSLWDIRVHRFARMRTCICAHVAWAMTVATGLLVAGGCCNSNNRSGWARIAAWFDHKQRRERYECVVDQNWNVFNVGETQNVSTVHGRQT